MSFWTVHSPDLRSHVLHDHGVPALRSAAVRLRSGGTLVVGPPSRAPDGVHDELATLGAPELLLAPNHFHNLGLAAWSRRYPDARTVASATAAPRLRRRVPVAIHPLADLAAVLPPHVTLLEPAGTRTGEVWLRVEGPDGVGWIVCDAFFNFPVTPTGPVGWIMAATAGSPGLRIGGSFRVLGLRDRPAYAAWLRARLAEDRPSWVLPAHGDAVEGDDVAARLTAVTDAVFGG